MQEQATYTVDVDAAYREHMNMVYKIALSQTGDKNDANDVFQEVFLRLVAHSHKICSPEHLKAWLIRVTYNCSKKHFKQWRMRSAELTEDIPSPEPEENDALCAVLELPPKYRQVIHMFYYEELSIKQICEVLRAKESTVKSQLSRGRDLLREKLKGEFGYFD